MTRQNGNGIIWKTAIAGGAVLVTIVLTLLGSGGSWGQQKQRVTAIEEKDKVQDVRLDCHEKELTALKVTDTTLSTNQQIILRRLDRQDDKLDEILKAVTQR